MSPSFFDNFPDFPDNDRPYPDNNGGFGMIKALEDIRKRGGAYCALCGIFFDDIIDARKHRIEQHYDYALAQCDGDKQLLLDSIKEFDGVTKSCPDNEEDFDHE